MSRAERRRLMKESRKQKAVPQFMREEFLANAMQELQKGNLDRADQLFKQLIASNPDDPTALHFGGITKYQLGSYKKALDLLSRATQEAPNYAEAFNSQGIVLLEQRNYEAARQSFERAINLKSDYSNAYANLGSSLRGLGKLSEACTAFQTSLQLNPQHHEAAYNLAASLLTQNNPADALEAADNCLAIAPYCQNANAYKAIALSQLERHSEWQQLYNFDEMIRKIHFEIPNGFNTLEKFNAQLEQDIRNHPTLTWEPLERVTRGGAVTKDILLQPTKCITVFEQTLRSAIEDYKKSLQLNSNHLFFGRLPANYRVTLIASILKAKGRHPPHIHESSWLSGVYYVRIPTVVNNSSEDHAGRLEFGKPDYLLPQNFSPEVTVRKPVEGTALFFPSYFFHGTIPFTGSEERIGIAFDVYPL